MKSRLLLGLTLVSFFCLPSHASREVLMTTMDNLDRTVEIIGEREIGEEVFFRKIRAKIGMRKYRIASTSHYEFMEQLCKPYMKKYPSLESTVETAKWYQSVVYIDPTVVVHPEEKETTVIHSVICGKKPR